MLYIVGTAIGNIEDTSLRAVKTLTESDIILAEDTATFDTYYNRIQKLFSITPTKKQQFVHFHKENEFEKLPWVIEQLDSDKIISLVSESGLPTISDPGSVLVKYLTKVGIPFTVIPGPTAFTTAAILSGFPTKNILFLGFLPKKGNRVFQLFNQLKQTATQMKELVIVFYESPHRIESTMSIIKEVLPNADVAVARELTKKFEEVIRIKSKDIDKTDFKGEITVVLKLKV